MCFKRTRWFLAIVPLLALHACAHKKGRIEGRIEYIDSRWDPSMPATYVPAILVHAMPGGETERREILDSYLAALRAKDPVAPDPSFVDHVIALHAPGAVIDAVETDSSGGWSLDGMRQGTWLVFAEYTTDLGHFMWIETVELQGTRTVARDLGWDNRLIMKKPKRIKTSGRQPPPYEAVRDPKLLDKYILESTP